MKISELELLDLDDLYDLSDKIEKASLGLEKARQDLSNLLASITKLTTNDPIYWVGGKPPSMSYIKEQYHVLGYSEETFKVLLELREYIYTLEADKAKHERNFNLGLKLLDVWRTYSANKRRAINSLDSNE